MIKNKEEFFQPVELRRKTVNIPRLGELLIQEMSQAEGARFEMFVQRKGVEEPQRKLKLITLCVIDEDGNTLLNESDFARLSQLPATAINMLAYEIMLINGFLNDGVSKEDFAKEETAC